MFLSKTLKVFFSSASKLPSLTKDIQSFRRMSTQNFPNTSLHAELPRNVQPLSYKIHCSEINQQTNYFKGTVIINFRINSSTSSIILHQKNLDFESGEAIYNVTKTQQKIPVTQITKNDEDETAEFHLQVLEPLTVGSLQLSIEYSGKIRKDMGGFYSSSYKDFQGTTNYILATQFESSDARSAFPCYDEPNCKANFEISMTVASGLEVLSNMPISDISTMNSLKTFSFAKSPKMSTYLVAWAIGNFEYVEGFSIREYRGSKLPIRVYTIPGQSQNGEYALQVAQRAADYLSSVFDIDYPLPKLDLIAVPQFGANAMENWGLVTFRATALLFNPKTSNVIYKQNVAYVVSHEIAHSWFGNYCTMNWWSDLWLNESFATFIGWLCVDHMHKDWDVFTDFVSSSVQVALDLDSLKNSHPVEVQVYHSNEIDEIFDAISYLKGGSIIRMVAEAVGIELFLKGVSNYLKKYAYGNAKSDDLWDAISEVSGKDITKLVEPWIRAVGYPYLKAEKLNEKEIRITQRRFLTEGCKKDDDKVIWWIPNIDNMQTKEKIIPAENFLKLNKDTTGFYRVVYDDDLFKNIVSNLNKLTAKDKIGLIADASAAAQSDLMLTSQFLELVNRLKEEANVAVWTEITLRLNQLKTAFFEDSKISAQLVAFTKDLYKSKFLELSRHNSELSFADKKLNSILFSSAGVAGLKDAIVEAKKIYNSGNIDPVLKQAVFRTLVSNPETCDDKIVNELLLEVANPSSIDALEISLDALGSIYNTEKYLPKILDLFFNGTVLEMDFKFLTLSLSANPYSKIEFWKFFKKNYPKFRRDVSMWTFDRVLKGFLPLLSSSELLSDIDNFFNQKNNTGYDKGLKQGLDSIKNNVTWAKSSRDDVSNWLIAKGY